jgi:hypothetical protein
VAAPTCTKEAPLMLYSGRAKIHDSATGLPTQPARFRFPSAKKDLVRLAHSL